MATGNWYRQARLKAWGGSINWASDSIKMALLTAGYTPNLDTHVAYSDISASEATGTGYTAGGQALTTKTITYTTANSWGSSAAVSTAYTVGQIVRPATGNGHLYRCDVAGTSAGTAPTWPTVSFQDVTDGSVTWSEIGAGIFQLSSAAVTWATSTITAQYAAIYDAQSGTAATEYLIALINFGSALSSTAGPFTVTPDPLGWAIDTVS